MFFTSAGQDWTYGYRLLQSGGVCASLAILTTARRLPTDHSGQGPEELETDGLNLCGKAMSFGMDVFETAFPEVKLITPKSYGDVRGRFAETYNKRDFAKIGIVVEFVQDNHSYSAARGTVRGLHFQLPPYAQDKLVRVVKGSMFDVAVDLRQGSPSLGQHVSAILTATEGTQIFVPVGFAHGFCTLEPDTEVTYKTSNYYAPDHDAGVVWNDPDLGIDWPVRDEDAVLSEKDKKQPRFVELAAGLPQSWQAAG